MGQVCLLQSVRVRTAQEKGGRREPVVQFGLSAILWVDSSLGKRGGRQQKSRLEKWTTPHNIKTTLPRPLLRNDDDDRSDGGAA